MFGLGKSKPVVGLDIGSSAVKAIELRLAGKAYKVSAFASEPVPQDSIVDGAIVDGAAVADAVRRVFDRKAFTTKDVALSLSGSAVIVKKINLPVMTEAELGEVVVATLLRARFAAKVEIALEEHTSTIVFGAVEGMPTRDYGEPAVEVLDADTAGEPVDLELLRVEAGTPAWGKELDDRILPAEAGLEETHISFTKGCYPGQEPIARLHHRGHANRGLRVLHVDAQPGEELVWEGKTVGRVTSAVPGAALAYVRTEVPEGAELLVR